MHRRSHRDDVGAARAALLFALFAVLLLAYYHIKPASRSLFIASLGADRLPWVWIASAVTLGLLIGVYHRLVERHSRARVVRATLWVAMGALAVFSVLLRLDSPPVAVAFYVFTDIFSVVLVEQMWSLVDGSSTTEQGKRWYGLVGAGAVTGGVAGAALATALLRWMELATADLLYVAMALLLLVLGLLGLAGRAGWLGEGHAPRRSVGLEGLRAMARNRYLRLIAALLLCAQFAEPVIEFQFAKALEAAYPQTDLYTAQYALYLFVVNVVALAVNLLVTPLVHGSLGVVAGLAVQPALVLATAVAFHAHPTALVAGLMKVSDRGLSYSINRASKELLYLPIAPLQVHQAKAWIDMFGYRLFKVLGAVTILALTGLTTPAGAASALSVLTAAVCAGWLVLVVVVGREYRALAGQG